MDSAAGDRRKYSYFIAFIQYRVWGHVFFVHGDKEFMPGKTRVAIQKGLHRVIDIRNFIQLKSLFSRSGCLGGGAEEKYFDGR